MWFLGQDYRSKISGHLFTWIFIKARSLSSLSGGKKGQNLQNSKPQLCSKTPLCLLMPFEGMRWGGSDTFWTPGFHIAGVTNRAGFQQPCSAFYWTTEFSSRVAFSYQDTAPRQVSRDNPNSQEKFLRSFITQVPGTSHLSAWDTVRHSRSYLVSTLPCYLINAVISLCTTKDETQSSSSSPQVLTGCTFSEYWLSLSPWETRSPLFKCPKPSSFTHKKDLVSL